MKNKKWLIAIGAFLVTTAYGFMLQCKNVFIIPVCEYLNCTRAQYSIMSNVYTICGAICSPIIGLLAKKYGTKKIMLTTGVIIALFIASHWFATTMFEFIVIEAITGICYNGICFLTATMLINEWFDEDKGKAAALATAGSGIGSAVMIPVAQKIVEAYSFKEAYVFIAFCGLILILFATIFLIKDNNEQLLTNNGKKTKVKFNFTLAGAMAFMGLAFNAVLSSVCFGNTNPFLQASGYSATYASKIVSIGYVSLTVMKFVMGYIYDKYGVAAGNMVIGLSSLTYPAMMLFDRINGLPLLTTLDYGISGTCNSITRTILINDVFGKDKYVSVYSALNIAYNIIVSIASVAIGGLYDITGTYFYSKLICCLIGVISFVNLGFACYVKRKEQNKKSMEA